MAEWFRALDFNSVVPGSNPSLATSWSCFSVVRVQLLRHACTYPTSLPPASWDSYFLFSVCYFFLGIYFLYLFRLRVVSNFGDGDCGAGEIHTRAREISRRRDAKGAPKISAPFASCRLEISRACVCVYFARPTIAIAKIRDYSQSNICYTEILTFRMATLKFVLK